MIVKGCLDDCSTCEPAREKEIELELARKELENELLKRRIALLDKEQEYRCCPDDDEPEESSEFGVPAADADVLGAGWEASSMNTSDT